MLERRDGAAGEPRLAMLETVRAYARGRLDADADPAEVHRRHRRHYLGLVESAEPALSTGAEREWLARLDAEVDNIRAALDWSLAHDGATLGLRLAGLLADFWDIRGMSAEGLQWLDTALEVAADDMAVDDRARARRAQAKLLEEQGSVYHADLRERARACAIGALALSRRTGDPAAIADALLLLGHLEPADGFPERRRHAPAQEALVHARRAADPRLVAGLAAPFAGELDAAQSAFEQQLRICRQLVIPWLASEGLAGLAAIATRHGEPDRAAHLFGAAAAARGPVGDADVIARLEHRFFAPASQDYGDRPWHQARTAGAELAFTDAIDFALEPADHHAHPAPMVNAAPTKHRSLRRRRTSWRYGRSAPSPKSSSR